MEKSLIVCVDTCPSNHTLWVEGQNTRRYAGITDTKTNPNMNYRIERLMFDLSQNRTLESPYIMKLKNLTVRHYEGEIELGITTRYQQN